MNDMDEFVKLTAPASAPTPSSPGIGNNSMALANVDRLAELAHAINAKHKGVGLFISEASANAIECGRLLLEARKLVPDGEWHRWLRENTTVTVRTAQRWIEAAEKEAEHPRYLQR